MWPNTIVASGTRIAACSSSSGVQNGSSPQWISVGAPSRAAARISRSELSSAGCAIVVTGCSLSPTKRSSRIARTTSASASSPYHGWMRA